MGGAADSEAHATESALAAALVAVAEQAQGMAQEEQQRKQRRTPQKRQPPPPLPATDASAGTRSALSTGRRARGPPDGLREALGEQTFRLHAAECALLDAWEKLQHASLVQHAERLATL